MPFKTVLTVVGPQSRDGDLKLGVDLCRREGAHLSVLALSHAAPPPVAEFAGIASQAWVEQRQEALKELEARAAAAGEFLAGASAAGDVATEYADAAWADETVGRRGRYADLTLVGPDMLADARLRKTVIEGALFHSGKPVLLAPKGIEPTLKPRRVIVAWDIRIEATRAVREALDMLAQAEEVRLVLVDPVRDEFHHGDEPGADAATFMARHGIKVAVDRLPSQNMSVAEVLSRHARDHAADMLVMGAYGHSRARQRIFGGVTRSMIDMPPLPVFMAR